MNRSRLLAVSLLFTLVGWALPAHAADTWTTPYHGIRRLFRTTSTPHRINALEVNLCARGVSLRATAGAEKWRRTSSFGALVGAEAAINADFFSYDTHLPTGQAKGNGTQWNPDPSWSGTLAFGSSRALLDLPGRVLADLPWIREAIGGRPALVVDGKAATTFNRSDCSVRHPRTAVGLSRDRQTLYLAVVDGRSSRSVGMTCRELALLMESLGAHTAMNVDGGGSSTMWLKGSGVVNDPSDASGERTVSNHLAVQAGGTGAPGSCDWSEDEVLLDATTLDEDDGGTVDINGDGRADVCARAAAGLYCYPSTGTGFGTRFLLDGLSNAAGFSSESTYSTLRMADLDGDGRTDVCARSVDGVRCWHSTGTGWNGPVNGPALSDTSGWNKPQYFSTLRLGDINGDGMADLCARAAAGLRCWPSTGTGFGAAITGPALSDANGWDATARHGTIRLADVNGDGKADVCARAAGGLRCWFSDGTGFAPAINGPAWSDANGFGALEYWSTLRMADVDGDGRADACIRTATRVDCHLSNGGGFGAALAGPALADDSGWGDHSNYATLRQADVDGDGDLDFCARSNARIRCWPFTGQGFGGGFDGPALSDAAGWADFRFYATLRMGDLDGDRKADLCARGAAGWSCHPSTGTGFGAAMTGPAWSDEVGWAGAAYFTTIRMGGPRFRPELCNGRDDDGDGAVDNGCASPDAGMPVVLDAGPAGEADAGAAAQDGGVPGDAGLVAGEDGGARLDGGEPPLPDEDSGPGFEVPDAAGAPVDEDAGGNPEPADAGQQGADPPATDPADATSECACSRPTSGWTGGLLLALVALRRARRA